MNNIYLLVLLSNLMFGTGQGNEKIDEIIAHHKEAIGYETLAEVQSLVLIGERETCVAQYDTCFTDYYKEVRKRPELYYNESESFGYKNYLGFDGKTYWTNMGSSETNTDYINIYRFKANLDGLVHMYNKGWIRGSKIIMGEKKVLELDIYTDHNQQIKVRLNPKTYLITSILFEEDEDHKYTIEYIFSKYKKVKKVKVPFKEEFISKGELFSVIEYHKVLINQKIENEIFKKAAHVK
jgi:hypothetical protein